MLKYFCTLFIPVFLSSQSIVGSKHDFSSSGWNWVFMQNGNNEICVPCHTPHNANAAISEAPLWNHDVTSSVFTIYSSTSLNATVSQPTESSKLCLSCHDGTLALDSFGGNEGTVIYSSGHSGSMGTDLTNDHPISIVYDATLASSDGELKDPTSQNSGLGGTIGEDLLFNNEVQCASCHDVHNSAGVSSLLRMDNTGSNLCLACHIK